MQAAIYGLSGERLTPDERALFRAADPAGYILFRRNCTSRDQMRALTDDLRALHGRDTLAILIDQEGGRVARMRPPEWPAFPSGEAFANLYRTAPASALEAARANARALGLMLRDVGVNVDCLPMLDVRQDGAHDIVGDRALGDDPLQVASLGRAILRGLASAGAVGVIKHIPGHGRALADSHHELPIVDASEEELAMDLLPFERLNDAPMGMVSHILYTAWDKAHPASQSPTVIHDIIRTRIGFDGFLMSDDTGMNALGGDPATRALACVAAGCDVALPCDGVFEHNRLIADAIPDMTPRAAERLAAALAVTPDADDPLDLAAAMDKRDQLLALA